MDLKHRLLHESFGYTEFRPGQQKLIDAILAGQDVLGVMPTGAGKSICYQLSGMLLPGVTLVVSPLISLMQDQVAALQRKGIAACLLNSAQTVQERHSAIQLAAMGRAKLIYVAPERLLAPDFATLAQRLSISMIAVDEAHCISQWGHDFRPSYRQIPKFIRNLPERPIVSAFTATATAQVRQDIVDALELRMPERLITSFDRPNLHYAVLRAYDREAQLVRFIRQQAGACGIVYCLTRKKTEEMAQYLCDNDIPAIAYHAGIDAMVRRDIQVRFASGTVSVIVATNAFGMGINKLDVRFVVHFGMPRDIESYYQEAGRAGRDGVPAHCLLLFDENDINLHEYLIGLDPENPALTDEEVERLKKHNLARLKQMRRYVFTDQCLRQYILQYFGQDAPDFCGSCSNCEASSVERDVTTGAQKVLSCVYRVGEQCNADVICQILLGSADAGIQRYATVSTYGIMQDSTAEDIRAIVDHLVSFGYLVKQENPHPRLRLCASAKRVLFHGEKVALRVRVSQEEAREARENNRSSCPELAKELREYRRSAARRRGVLPYTVMPDTMLEQLVQQLPRTEDAVQAILHTDSRQGKRDANKIAKIIQKYCMEHFIENK